MVQRSEARAETEARRGLRAEEEEPGQWALGVSKGAANACCGGKPWALAGGAGKRA